MKNYTSHTTTKMHDEIAESLRGEINVVLVSDAGTPGISDPGVMLIRKVRDEVPKATIVSIPGPSAIISALSISGFPSSEFTFYGFLPHKKGRETLLKKIAIAEHVVIVYESTHRLVKLLGELQKHVGERMIGIGKELTKMHEGFYEGTAQDLIELFTKNPAKTKGEVVVIVGPKEK
jgi:16S rRNA (cytidine1402-2'-O)-methyltransferase